MKLFQKIALIIAFSTLSINSSFAATFTVTNTENENAGSLRAAIDLANNTSGDDIIDFLLTEGQQTINLTSGFSVIDNLRINGLGADQLSVSGDYNFNIFDIASDVTVEISGLTITRGSVNIYNRGTAILTNSTISNSFLGIDNRGIATFTNSTVSDNLVGIGNKGTATITSSTISNSFYGVGNQGTATITNSTISDSDTGIYNEGTVTVTNTTISTNQVGINNLGTLNKDNIIFAENTVDIIDVPEPSAILGLVSLALFGLLRKKASGIYS
ncbi:MAG TPA: PEP-CTERM sorting domain-containing protein [Oculatellaceae cyanobacterium]|jgi:hypothetical protein